MVVHSASSVEVGLSVFVSHYDEAEFSALQAGTAVAESLSTEALYVQGDVSTKEGCDDLVAKSLEKFGRLDYLINNAGMNMGAVPHSDLDAVDEDAMRKVFDVNMFGVFYMCRAAMPSLKASGNGCIINVTSVAGVRPGGSSIPYSMSKAAVNHLYVALRLVAPAVDHPRLCRSSLATPPSCLLPPAPSWQDAAAGEGAWAGGPRERAGAWDDQHGSDGLSEVRRQEDQDCGGETPLVAVAC